MLRHALAKPTFEMSPTSRLTIKARRTQPRGINPRVLHSQAGYKTAVDPPCQHLQKFLLPQEASI